MPGDGDTQPLQLVVDVAFAPRDKSPSRVVPPEMVVHSLSELVDVLRTDKLSLQDVLLSGVGSDRFDSLSGLSEMSAEQQLQRLLGHPVFQVR